MYVSKNNKNNFALYARLSQDDGDKVESCSISNQRELIHAYVEAHPSIKIKAEETKTVAADDTEENAESDIEEQEAAVCGA